MNEQDPKVAAASETSVGQDVSELIRHWLRGRRAGLVLGIAAGAGVLWLGWPILVAAGLAPLLIAILPCAAMCALGLCMRGGGKSCDSKQSTGADARALPEPPPIQSEERKEIDR